MDATGERRAVKPADNSWRAISSNRPIANGRTGLTVTAQFDTSDYPNGVKITHWQLKNLPITYDPWHGELNYILYRRGTPELH